MMTEIARKNFRDCIAVQFDNSDLIALRDGLLADDKAIIQAWTTIPLTNLEHDVECIAGCAISYVGMKRGHRTCSAAERFYSEIVDKAIEISKLNILWFLDWFDEGDRATVFADLAAEINAILEERGVKQ